MANSKAPLYINVKHQFIPMKRLVRENKAMLHIGKRIDAALRRAGLKNTDLAKACKVTPQAVSGWISSGRVDKRHLQVIAKICDVTVDWLLSNERSDTKGALMVRDEGRRAMLQAPSDKAVDIAVFDATASMGLGRDQHDGDTIVDHMRVSVNWLRENVQASNPRNLAVLTGYGDSMHPTFKDGDILLVDRGVDDLKMDAVYCLALRQQLYIKRIQRRPDGRYMMISDNGYYAPYEFTDEDMGQLEVLGRVLWAWNGRKL